MALKNPFARTVSGGGLLLVIFVFVFFNPISSMALRNGKILLPDFTNFTALVENDNVNVLSGVYVPNVLALPVVQQPMGDPSYVSSRDYEATQFATASHYGNIGLLAHNYLSGRLFSRLAVGQEVRLVYGDGKVEYFVITEVMRYQALEPNSQWSSFRNLDNYDVLSPEQMFTRAYAGDHHVTFQTCISSNGDSSWGRLFVVAVPKSFSVDHVIRQFLQ